MARMHLNPKSKRFIISTAVVLAAGTAIAARQRKRHHKLHLPDVQMPRSLDLH